MSVVSDVQRHEIRLVDTTSHAAEYLRMIRAKREGMVEVLFVGDFQSIIENALQNAGLVRWDGECTVFPDCTTNRLRFEAIQLAISKYLIPAAVFELETKIAIAARNQVVRECA